VGCGMLVPPSGSALGLGCPSQPSWEEGSLAVPLCVPQFLTPSRGGGFPNLKESVHKQCGMEGARCCSRGQGVLPRGSQHGIAVLCWALRAPGAPLGDAHLPNTPLFELWFIFRGLFSAAAFPPPHGQRGVLPAFSCPQAFRAALM